MEVRTERVFFDSDGLRLAGDLRVPERRDGPTAALVFTGPFTGVKEQVTGTYARRLAEAGYVTLAFDHRNFGESEGHPRQHEDAAGKVADLRNAVSFLTARDEVDPGRLGVVGVCLGTAYALRFAAFDPRVRAVALVAGAYNDPRAMRAGMGADGYRALLADLGRTAGREYRSGAFEYLPAVAEGGPAAMPGDEPFAYYGTARGAAGAWENRVTRQSIRELVTLDAASAADFVSPTPVLLVHGRVDGYCSPDAASEIYERLGEPKAITWLPTTNHIDLYDNEEFVAPAVERVTAWFDEHLARPAAPAMV